ncbi:hypothetical protein [Candidatus Vondammii sp. HM_W22]|uniref:hypothetical protein n=1 Tax=Candidatus Vondammii sp. HM_W22 TaxID=2687299 RepID=UPI001F1344E2|nr:hypothetical protein [Candidatus Vondammii sp. HM_W22]
MSIARIVLLVFAFINVLGLVWFFEDVSGSTFIYGITTISCALIVAFVPGSAIDSSKHIGMIVLLLCVIGVIAISLLILQDYQRKYGADTGAIFMRVLFASVFVSVGLEIRRRISK